MKNILIIIILAVFGGTFWGCSDAILDTKPLDKFSEEAVWGDAKLAQGFIYDAYRDIVREYLLVPNGEGNYYGAGNDDFSDNIIISSNKAVNINKDLMTVDDDFGWDAFSFIRQANLIIEKSEASEVFTEAEKTYFVGQGKMLRAMIYFDRAKMYGKYVVIDKVLSPSDDLKLARTSTIKETYDFILKDLADAAEALPTDGEAGTFTKGAALALRAEVALQGAAYIESGADEYYDIAKKASEALFALGKYSLDPEYQAMFNDYAHGLSSSEMIFALYRSKDVTQCKRTPMQRIAPNAEQNALLPFAWPPLVQNFLGWGTRWPSQDLVNEYEVIDTDGKAKKWNETSYYADYQANGGYVSSYMFKNRDSRFYASIAYDSSMIYQNRVLMRVKGNMHWNSLNKHNTLATKSGYFVRKSLYEDTPISGNNYTSYHHSIFRLGRSYLNYAEAMYRLGEEGIARDYINKTRTTHGNLPALDETVTGEDLWEAYKSERRVELFFEGDRYWSLLRWGKVAGLDVIPELNKAFYTWEIQEDGQSIEEIDVPVVHSINIRSFSKRRYLFPVPRKQRELNENLDQNPEW